MGRRLVEAYTRPQVIEDLLRFFQKGDIVKPPTFEDELPKFVRPGLVAIRQHLLSVQTVQMIDHPVEPLIKEAKIGFSGIEPEGDIFPWRVIIAGRDEPDLNSGLSYLFTSFLTAPENLANFTLDVLSSEPDTSPLPGERTLEEWMIWARQNRIS